jgi:hypothetical protein
MPSVPSDKKEGGSKDPETFVDKEALERIQRLQRTIKASWEGIIVS